MITDNIELFIRDLIKEIDNKVDVSNLVLDHFGYQTKSYEDYENKKKDVLNISTLVSENIVSGRRVGIFKLNKEIIVDKFKVLGFELIEPKEAQMCKSELDHIEFVIKESFDEFLKEYPNVNFDLSAMNRSEFPKITLKLNNGKSIKFHKLNIFDEIPKY